jgi:predicted enzyme involved in methoxymalonyl-ACP biosynthesis
VETALLAKIVGWARARGASMVEGRYLPTKKNAPARDFFASHGFSEIEATPEETRFLLDLSRGDVGVPAWIPMEGD